MDRDQFDRPTEEIPRDRSRSPGPIDPHKTPIKMTLAVAFSIAVALVGAGIYVGSAVSGFTARLKSIEEHQADMLTKTDIAEIKRWVPEKFGTMWAKLKVSCPHFVVRGAENVFCSAVPIGSTQDEP